MDTIAYHSNLLFDSKNEIHIDAWQNSTIEETNNTHELVCVTISPSQFRSSLSSLSSPSDGVAFARRILQFVIEHIRCSQILVLIADQIQKYNISVFGHRNEKRSLEIAIAQGQKITEFFTEAYGQLSLDGSQKIKIITWADILLDDNYDHRVQHIRQYIYNNQSVCVSLIDKVCDAYVQARCSVKHCKEKDLILLREYIINELPVLLNGVQYEGNLYTFMLHPTLNTGNRNGKKQREAMTQLLDHMRREYLPDAIYTTAPCHIFDVDIPVTLINNDMFLTHSSSASAHVNRISSQNLEESSGSISNIGCSVVNSNLTVCHTNDLSLLDISLLRSCISLLSLIHLYITNTMDIKT